jgi:hypothetical protein
MNAEMRRFLATLGWLFYRRSVDRWKSHVFAGLASLIIVAAGAIQFDLFGQASHGRLSPGDNHAAISMDQALVFSFCGKYGFRASHPTAGDPKPDAAPGDANIVPYAATIAAQHDSLERYCQSSQRFLNNENGLFIVMAALLALPPDDTPRTLAIKITAFRCALLFVALYAMGLAGLGLLPLAAIGLIAARAQQIGQETHLASVYTALPIVLLVTSASFALLYPVIRRHRANGIIAAGIGFGLLLGFVYNFRTTYLLAVLAQLAAALTVCAIWERGRLLRYVALIATMTAGFAIFQAALIWPLQQAQSGYRNAHHSIWHPIVLGLGAIGAPLTEREGIKWDDPTGHVLATRIDPTVVYLGPGYDEALRTYYFRLWQEHPAEMREIYRAKFFYLNHFLGLAGSTAYGWPGFERWFERRVSTGYVWFYLLFGAVLLSVLAYPVAGSLAILTGGLAASTIALSVEQAVIGPFFFAFTHQGPLIVASSALACVLMSLAVAGIARLWKILVSRRVRPGAAPDAHTANGVR